MDEARVGARTTFSVILCCLAAGVVACSSEAGDPAPDLRLEGRYAISSSEGASFRFGKLWLSGDGRFEGLRAACTADCTEKGTYTYARGELALMNDAGTTRLRIDPSVAAAASVGPRSLRPQDSPSMPAGEVGSAEEELARADDQCGGGKPRRVLHERASAARGR